jgi:hypothetical protein
VFREPSGPAGDGWNRWREDVDPAAFGDRIALAVTLNEPNLPRLLTRIDLHAVDRDTFARRPKPSADAYAAIVAANGFA